MSRPPQIIFASDLLPCPFMRDQPEPSPAVMLADELSKYGYREGKLEKWCACCTRTFIGAADAFNCKVCAKSQRKEVIKICEDSGLDE